MSNLTGQQIKNTYQGLLKLADSSTGITSSFQSIQDGLGNDTGSKISINHFDAPNVFSSNYLMPQYMGAGFNLVAGNQYAAGTQNIIMASPFYDNGVFAYSAMSYYLGTATSTSDTCEAAIYSAQYVNGGGLQPKDVIISGLTITTTGATGIKTVSFPSNISMSGIGSGAYFLVFKISNGGVQPTFRPGPSSGYIGQPQLFYGSALNVAGTAYGTPIKLNTSNYVYSGTSTFENPYTSSIAATQSSTANILGNAFGLILHVVGA